MSRRNNNSTWGEVLRPWDRTCVILCVGSVVRSIAAVGMALASKRLLDSAAAGSDVWHWGALLAALAVGLPLLSGVLSRLGGAAEDASSALLRQKTLQMLRTKDLQKLKDYHSGQLFSRVTADVGTLCQWKTAVLPGIVSQFVRLGAAAAALFYIAPTLALWGLVCAAVVGAGSLCYRRILQPRHRAARMAQEELTISLQEELGHGEFIRSVGAQRRMDDRLARRQETWRKKRGEVRDVTVLGGTAFSVLTQLIYAAVLLWGGLTIRAGTQTIGDLTALLQLAAMFQGPVSGLGGLQSRLAERAAARERLEELWTLPEESQGQPLPEGAKVRAIVFEGVTFRYAGEEAPVLENLSLRLSADRWYCLRGISGSGKSTLYRLILGLYRPQSGRVYLETEQGNYDCCAATRSVFAFVPQTPVLLAGTVRENLHLIRPDASDDALCAALWEAQCDFLFAPNARGLDIRLSEDGGLSAGQRQRIAVAMALLSGGQVLLLDEITSALDADTERALLKALRTAHPAALFATHHIALPDTLEAQTIDLDRIP